MNLLALRDRIRTKAIANSLTYTEIETLFDVNELLNQTMPCLAWRYSGETNNFDEVGTEMSLNIYLLTEFPDSVKTETADYQRDYIVTQQDALRTFFYTWLQAMPFESGSDFLEVLSTEEIPIAERLSINAFLTMEFRVNISIKRDFCVEPEEIAPTADEVKVYFNSVLKYTQACNVDLELTLKNQDGDDIDATFNGYDIVVTQGGGDATININGVLWDVIAAGDTEDIIVRQSSGSTQVGSKQGQYYRIGDSDITLEDALGTVLSTTNVKAEDDATIIAPNARVSNSDDSYDVNVASGGDLELPDITISNSNDSYSVTSPSVKDVDLPNITLANSDGSLTASIPSAQDVTITDVTISNSDSSYSASSPYNPNLSVPDITISNSDDSYSVTSPSVIDVDIPDESITVNSAAFITKPSKKDQDILLKDVSGNTITPEALSGNTITILDAVVGGSKGLMPLQTGATTSYATGDDGDLERGRLVNLLTLPYNNGFGGTERYTDELGGQTFTKNIIIDWSTWDGGTDVLGYIFTFRSTSHNGTKSWTDWMSGQPYTTDGFSDWNVVNTNEVLSLYDITTTNGLDYAPLSNTTGNSFWTSLSLNGTQAYYNNRNTILFRKTTVSTTLQSMLVRTFNWNGTTLS
jgi:hypothetical protein